MQKTNICELVRVEQKHTLKTWHPLCVRRRQQLVGLEKTIQNTLPQPPRLSSSKCALFHVYLSFLTPKECRSKGGWLGAGQSEEKICSRQRRSVTVASAHIVPHTQIPNLHSIGLSYVSSILISTILLQHKIFYRLSTIFRRVTMTRNVIIYSNFWLHCVLGGIAFCWPFKTSCIQTQCDYMDCFSALIKPFFSKQPSKKRHALVV